MKKFILTTIFSLAIAGFAAAQSPKGAEQLRSSPKAEKAPSNVDGKFQILSSHIKDLGTIGKTGRYTIVSVKLRGLDSPNVSALLAYDSETDTLGTIASGVEPGLGVAIVNGGASVGSSFLFGSKLRPDRTSVSNDSSSKSKSESEGGDSAAFSKSEGGDAVSVSSSKSDSDASAGAISSSTSSVKNDNSNSQTQGQVQGQQQGQSSVNANSNNNSNQNANVNANNNSNHNKAPKAPAPKKSKKSHKH